MIYYSSVLTLAPLLALLDLGGFASMMRNINVHKNSINRNSQAISELLQTISVRYLFFLPFVTIAFIKVGPITSIYKVTLIVSLSTINTILLFVLRIHLAIGNQATFYRVTSKQHFWIPIILLLTFPLNLSLEWEIVSILTVSVILNFVSSLKLLIKFNIKVTRISPMKIDRAAFYFFIIGIELGFLYQWDRLWVHSLNLDSANVAHYSIILFIYASTSSLISIDYQRIWHESISGIPINYTRTCRRVITEAIPLAILLGLSVLIISLHYNSNFQNSLTIALIMVFVILVQSFHNINSALTSTTIFHLRLQAGILGLSVLFRFIILHRLNTWGDLSTYSMILTWAIPIASIQIPAVYALARRARIHA